MEWRIDASVNRAMFGSDNGLAPGRRQAIIWSNAGILVIGPLWTNFSEMLIEYMYIFIYIYIYIRKSIWKVVWKMKAILSRPPCV